MRVLIFLALAVTLASTARADDATEARALIDKAIQSVGGEAKLSQAKTFSQKVSGTFFGPAGPVSFRAERVVNLPDQLRETADADGNKYHVVKAIVRDNGWIRVGDSLREMDKDTLAGEHQQMYAAHLATLLPLKEKEYSLAPLGESKVGDRSVLGVKVSHADRSDVSLFFDKEKGWLLKAEFTAKLPSGETKQIILYDDYQDVNGLKRPAKTTIRRDGRVLVEAKNSEYKPLDKVDAKLFEKPQ